MSEYKSIQRSTQREKGNGADKILAELYRQIAQIILPILPKLINRHLERRGIYKTVKDIASARGNIIKEQSAPTMSWKVFCKSLDVIGVKKMRINMDITWGNNRTITYSKDVYFNNIESEEEVLEDAELRDK